MAKKRSKEGTAIIAIGAAAGALYLIARPAYEAYLIKLKRLIGIEETPSGAVIPPANASISVVVLDPSPGENWARFSGHTVDYQITNNNAVNYSPVYFGMSIQTKDGVLIKDYPVTTTSLAANETKTDFRLIMPQLWTPGAYQVRVGVWRTYPEKNKTPITDLIGDSGWIDFNIV